MRSARPLRRFLVSVLGAFALVLGTIGFTTPSQAATPTTWTVYVGSQSPSGQIEGMAFASADVSINVGDTIHFVVESMEPHTVSFPGTSCPAVGFDPNIACMSQRTVSPITSPSDFRSSGILSTEATVLGPPQTSWDLQFNGTGDFAYVCYLHGFQTAPGHYAGMAGMVHVRAAGTPYPQTQADIDASFSAARSAAIEDGNAIWGDAREAADPHHVFVGASDMTAMVMAFAKQRSIINVGESITFDLARNTVPVPHTVTFGPEPASLDATGEPTNFTGGTLSSGILLPPGFGPPGSSSYTVRFNKAGTYTVYCMLHDDMGMVGTIVVH